MEYKHLNVTQEEYTNYQKRLVYFVCFVLISFGIILMEFML